MKKPRHILIQFCCMLTLLATIMLQGFTKAVPAKPLWGFVEELDSVPLSFDTYYDGSYQTYLTEKARRNTGFREFFIRNYNQVLYTCFHKISNNNIEEGYDRECFLTMYLDEITGKTAESFFGNIWDLKTSAENNVQETLRLIDTLHQHGKEFLFVFAPTKTAVYAEKMPRYYQKRTADFSLEEYYIELFKANNIPHIDLYHYFIDISDTVRYPLYTKFASHWAESTIPMVADTILRKLESITNYNFPTIQVSDSNITTDYSGYDQELEQTMNLLFPVPKPALPRPVFDFKDTSGMDRPNLVIVGDSYFEQLMFSCFKNTFNRWDYWQYMLNVYSSRDHFKELFTDVLDTPKTLQDADIVLAIFTAPNLYNYMYGFPNKAYEMLNDSDAEVLGMMEYIRREPDWWNAVVEQAEKRDVPVMENLRINAEYILATHKNQLSNPDNNNE